MSPTVYRLLVILHLLGAAIWVGGHIVLSLAVLPRALKAKQPAIVLDFEAGFERIGIPALLVQVVTGVLLALRLLPDPGSWWTPTSPLGWFVLGKVGLLAATVTLAAHARIRIIPKLDAARLPVLALHVVAVTLLGVAFLVLGAAIRTGGLP